MGAEQRVSASVFTHRGEDFDSNTGNYILDGRQPYDFELDNSHVSILDRDKYFFFAVCDTRPTDDLNTSVSGIKELKKLHAQLKSGSRDIKSKTEMLGESFMETEELLYDTAAFSDGKRQSPRRSKPLASLDKKLVTYPGKDIDDDETDADDTDGEFDEDGRDAEDRRSQRGRAAETDDDGDYDDEYDDDGEEDGFAEVDDQAGGEGAQVPGRKGFSSVGFILSDKKGSILAQGECEAFMFRGGSLRVLSGGPRKVSVPLNRPGAAQQRPGFQAPRPYGGRSSEIFDPRPGDIYLLCTSSVVLAVGEENIDNYLAMPENLIAICGTIMYDAVKADPNSNMTCMLVKVEEDQEDYAAAAGPAAAGAVPARRGQDAVSAAYGGAPDQQVAYPGAGGHSAAFNAGAAAATAGMAGTGAYGGARPPAGQPPRQGPGAPQYAEQDPRALQQTYQNQNRDAFTRRATSRFEAPSRRTALSDNRSLIIAITTTVVLLALLFLGYFLIVKDQGGEVAGNPTPTPTASARQTSTTEPLDDEEGGGEDSTTEPTEERTSATTTTPTTTTTTEPPEQEYTVKSGDTLIRIAQRFYGVANGDQFERIKERNGMTNDQIDIGQVLIIPPLPTATTTAASASSPSGADGEGAGTTAGRQSVTTAR